MLKSIKMSINHEVVIIIMKCNCGSTMYLISQFDVNSKDTSKKMTVVYKCADCGKTKYNDYKA